MAQTWPVYNNCNETQPVASIVDEIRIKVLPIIRLRSIIRLTEQVNPIVWVNWWCDTSLGLLVRNGHFSARPNNSLDHRRLSSLSFLVEPLWRPVYISDCCVWTNIYWWGQWIIGLTENWWAESRCGLDSILYQNEAMEDYLLVGQTTNQRRK